MIEAANNSTLFLDEINSFPLSLQGKLLRVLEDKHIKPLGAIKGKQVNFRLIAATNVDLEHMVRQGTFRADLFYRLNVVPLRVPPLSEHKEDILPLCQHFLDRFQARYGRTKRLSKPVLQALCRYDWPGNVRELRNLLERLIVMTPPDVLTIHNIPPGMLTNNFEADVKLTTPRVRQQLTYDEIIAALEVCGEHRERTARYLGISRRTLQYKLKEMGIVGK